MANHPDTPASRSVALRGDYSQAASDYTVSQDWEAYGRDDHAVWHTLYARQIRMLAD
jgi:phenylalanine-4-hydroxylase